MGGGWGDWGGMGEGWAQWVLRCWEDGGQTQIVCIMVQRKRTLHDDELKVTRLYYTRIASRCYDLLVLKGKLNTDLSLAHLRIDLTHKISARDIEFRKSMKYHCSDYIRS